MVLEVYGTKKKVSVHRNCAFRLPSGFSPESLPSRGCLGVANHPIIWIKQVAPHWESSLKRRSILALGCLWKWKHISCLPCSDFSNKARLRRREALPDTEWLDIWTAANQDLVAICLMESHGGLVIMVESSLGPWALPAEHNIPSALGRAF